MAHSPTHRRGTLLAAVFTLAPLVVAAPTAEAATDHDVVITTEGRGELALTLPESTTPAVPARNLDVSEESDLVLETVVSERGAATEYTYIVDLPVEGRIEVTAGGGALVLDPEDTVTGVFSPPEARDTNGAPVPTVYRTNGADLVLTIDHVRADHPVTATTTAAATLVAGVAVENHPEGTRYLVTPTSAGRTATGNAAYRSGFDEAVALGVADRNNLFDQYRCHPMSQIARLKESWNLEDWRPDVGIIGTIAAACNP